MRNPKQKQNSLKNELHLFTNSFESLRNSKKKSIFRSTITPNNTNKYKNKLILNSFNKNLPTEGNKSNNKIKLLNYRNKRNFENIKNESMNESEISEAKILMSHRDEKLKKNKFFLNNINFRNSTDKSKTFKYKYRNTLKNPKEPYKVFKTNLNESANKDKNLFLYENDEENFQRNDLEIPDEDKIFEEFQKYDHFTERYNKLYKIKTNNGNDIKDFKTTKSVRFAELKKPQKKEEKKFTKTFYDPTGKFIPSNLDKDIFDCLYKTSDDFYTQLNILKKAKKTKKLKDYQNDLLEHTKDIISVYGYNKLKQHFDDIQKFSKFKRRLNFKFIKKIENDEKKIIEDVIRCNDNYLNDEKSKGIKKYKFNLPNIEFKSVLKEELKKKKLLELMKNKRNNSTKASKMNSSRSIKLKITKKEDKNKSKLSLFKVDK